jgi:ComF family protein
VKSWLLNTIDPILHLAFPHVCEGCGSDVIDKHHMLCLRCLDSLPYTHFENLQENLIEKIFWGRLPVTAASAQLYFTKESLVQRLINSFKYKGNKDLGIYLGKLMGNQLKASGRFSTVNALVPLPLFPSKEKKRGFNQAKILCDGIGEIMKIPVLTRSIIRNEHTDSQTKKSRVERWQNMEGKFEVADLNAITNKHILLVDDVVTTGATLEACGREMVSLKNTEISLATLCFSSH